MDALSKAAAIAVAACLVPILQRAIYRFIDRAKVNMKDGWLKTLVTFELGKRNS